MNSTCLARDDVIDDVYEMLGVYRSARDAHGHKRAYKIGESVEFKLAYLNVLRLFHYFLSESASEYFVKLKKLIEDTYSANGNKKITLMSHSLGCPYSLVFLNKQTQDWKDKYILQWITLSG